jgi:hypothetical protein
VLALTLFTATWITAIGWSGQPPTSEWLRARRAAALEAARAQSLAPVGEASPAEHGLDASGRPNLRELSSHTESLRKGRPTGDNRPASARPKSPDRQPAPAPDGNLDLRPNR